MNARRPLAALLAVVVALAGCANDDDRAEVDQLPARVAGLEAARTTTTTTEASTTTTTSQVTTTATVDDLDVALALRAAINAARSALADGDPGDPPLPPLDPYGFEECLDDHIDAAAVTR